MSHLMYSTNEDTIMTRDQIAALPLPAARGRFHQPYAFDQYIDDVSRALDLNGIQVAGEEYALTNDGNSMFGIMEIEAKPVEGELITANEWKMLLGLRGSHNQRTSRGLVLGTQVMVCSNLCFSGNVANLRTKQTTNIGVRLPGMIREAVAKVPALAQRQERVFDAYKNRELAPRAGDAALVEIYRRNGLTAAQLGTAINEWHEPSHIEHDQCGNSGWKLLNACTEALKPTGRNVNHETIAERSQIVTGFLDEITHIDF